MPRALFAFSIALLTIFATAATAGERLTPEKLWDLGRIGGSAVSPDGTQLAFLVTRYDLEENSGRVTLYLQDLPNTLPESPDRAAAFDSVLKTMPTKTLQSDVKGLHDLSWFDHSTGAKLVYIAPGASKEAAEGEERAEGANQGGGEGIRERVNFGHPGEWQEEDINAFHSQEGSQTGQE